MISRAAINHRKSSGVLVKRGSGVRVPSPASRTKSLFERGFSRTSVSPRACDRGCGKVAARPSRRARLARRARASPRRRPSGLRSASSDQGGTRQTRSGETIIRPQGGLPCGRRLITRRSRVRIPPPAIPADRSGSSRGPCNRRTEDPGGRSKGRPPSLRAWVTPPGYCSTSPLARTLVTGVTSINVAGIDPPQMRCARAHGTKAAR